MRSGAEKTCNFLTMLPARHVFFIERKSGARRGQKANCVYER